MPSSGSARRSALYIVGVVSPGSAAWKLSQLSSRGIEPRSAIATIQRPPSNGTNTAYSATVGGAGIVSTAFQSGIASAGICTTAGAYARSMPDPVHSGAYQARAVSTAHAHA